ncbi:phosphatase PAP2 family protein [Desulfothermus sp.]
MKRIINFLPIIFFIFLSLILSSENIEVKLLKYFYDPTTGWFLKNSHPWDFLYHFGPLPAIFMAVGGFLAFLGGFFSERLKKYKRSSLFLVLVMIIGPGLIVNTLLKDHWGRPRPRQTKQFNGKLDYHPFWKKGKAGTGKSFPSGHASMGFYLFTPYFILRKKNKLLAYSFLTLGLCTGSLIGLARMIQGGHYITDILYSGLIVYLTAVIISRFLLE